MIEVFLDKTPSKRILEDIKNLRAHEWFESIDWAALIRRELDVPYPAVIGNIDRELKAAVNKNINTEEIYRDNESDEEAPAQRSGPKKKTGDTNWDADF